MDDTAKRIIQPTTEIFTVILCVPNFAVSQAPGDSLESPKVCLDQWQSSSV